MIAGINLSGKPPFNGWLFCFYPNNPRLDPRTKWVRADFPFGFSPAQITENMEQSRRFC